MKSLQHDHNPHRCIIWCHFLVLFGLVGTMSTVVQLLCRILTPVQIRSTYAEIQLVVFVSSSAVELHRRRLDLYVASYISSLIATSDVFPRRLSMPGTA